MRKFQLNEFAKEGAKLLREVKEEFNRLGLDSSRLPKTFPDDNGKIKLVFVGQFGAGKSSLIKMLTGEDVEIGAAITTQIATPYDWNGLEIVDTPGIHTELRPDHDAITYDEINHAALLIFVITNEGFSQHMGDHFRELAINLKRAANMVLVVNKMDRTASGNVREQQQIIYADLKKVTTPYDPKQLYLSFTDTESYFKALAESDERRKNRRLEKSGREVFIANLNRFVAEKGILQKINLPLNTIAAEIRSASGGTFADKDVKALIATDNKRKEIFLDAQNQCLADINALIANFHAEISQLGRETAESAVNSGDNDKAQKIITAANDKVHDLYKDCNEKILARLKETFKDLDKTLTAYDNSAFVMQVNKNIADMVNREISSGTLAPAGLGAVLGFAVWQKAGQLLAPYAVQQVLKVPTLLTKASPLVDTAVNMFVTAQTGNPYGGFAAGKIAGALWERVSTATVVLPPTTTNKIAQFVTANAGKIGAAIGILGAAWTIYSMVKADAEQRKRVEEQRAVKLKIISSFEANGTYIGEQMKSAAKNFLNENINPAVESCDAEVTLIKAKVSESEVVGEKLSRLLKRTENLIGDIQKST